MKTFPLFLACVIAATAFVALTAMAVKTAVEGNFYGMIYWSMGSGITFVSAVYYTCCLALRDER